jgi:hypothetical protein
MNLPRNLLISILLVISAGSMALVAMIALLYSYSMWSVVESCVGLALLLIISVSLQYYRRRSSQRANMPAIDRAILVGIALGFLWTIEIGINNLVAPPLPTRDIIDDMFWAAIALSMLILAVVYAHRSGSIVRAVQAGLWSGLASGLVACTAALSVIVFGMRFVMQDPLNVAEWAERGISSGAPTMAAYFAFETFAGAFGHLLVLGIGMGGVLGVVGGTVGKGIQAAARWARRSRAVR